MPVPDYQTLMLPVLRAFGGGITKVQDALPNLVEEFALSDAEAQELIPSGGMTYLLNRAQWARTYLAKAGLLTSPRRGFHQITPAGEALLRDPPERMDNTYLRQTYPQFDAWVTQARTPRAADDPSEATPAQPRDVAIDHIATAPPDELIRSAAAEIATTLADDLLSQLHGVTPQKFERVVLDLLKSMGYGTGDFGTSMTTRATGDGGIDGIIHEDALGLDAVYIQAKRYAPENKVSRPAIQQFVGSLTGEGATKGVFVTTSGFSAEARDYLRRVQHRIVLIDGQELARRMIRHGVGVRVRETITIKGIDADYFDEG
jgi:restriction system protein